MKKVIVIATTPKGLEISSFGYESSYYHVPLERRFINDCKNRYLKKNGIDYHSVKYVECIGEIHPCKEGNII